ncbi:signal transduction histidine kinase with CheB and CheR activity [Rhodopirellula maiorica SM1]|uniref:histidine kinase n=1 Tax=Rhodopirellula maiorica SM1 TaxID=1265738 RepID=M5RPI5_9BACT|nr:CHASE3 domain-containing protein [Rhodopirellula maiorica]EMI21210.1 signal transduction histidine kinase with CheB and CheR activity [Rhodopirellula maiorica SM1]
MKEPDSIRRPQRMAEPFAVAAVVILLVITGFVTFHNTRRLRAHTDLVGHSHKLLGVLERIESTIKSAETGQRGFLITAQEPYLEPYYEAITAIDGLIGELESITKSDPVRYAKIAPLQDLIDQKLDELSTTLDVRRQAGFESAQTLVATNIGKRTMDSIHDQIAKFRRSEESSIARREQVAATTYWTALATGLISTVAGLTLVVGVLYLVQHNRYRAEKYAIALKVERNRLQETLDRARQLESENAKMDQYMRTFLEQIEDYAIFAMDAECRATTWNRGVLKVLGFNEADFIGKDIRERIFTPEAIAMGIPDSEFATAAMLGSASDDRWMMRADGERFWASGISSVVKDKDGKIVGYSKVMRDLTERKRDQDQLAELAAKLSEADRRKNEFLATLAHELRNPLAPIKNAIQLMSMSELPADTEELRQTMARQVEQLIRLIDDLLDVSRISRGKIQLNKEVVNLSNVIKAAVEASSTFIEEKEQHLRLAFCDQDVFVRADPARMTQVICNLLNNSSRYSDSDCTIDLSLSVQADEGDRGSAVIVVRDNGIGIATDRIDEIFQMFAQVDDSLRRGNAGLGIGLTLVKTLVEVHGGSVSAQSEGIGMGSTFTVRIPLADPSEETVAKHVATEPLSATKSFKVLVVEDMQALRTIMARLLTKLGHEVEVAEDGLSALEKLSESIPDVIFSDISMPGMTGYDLARKLRERDATANIYLVAMTGYGQSADREQAHNSGFDEHMIKPVDITKLQSLFQRLSARGDRP